MSDLDKAIEYLPSEQNIPSEEKIRQKKAEAAEKAKKKAQKDEEFRKQWESWNRIVATGTR